MNANHSRGVLGKLKAEAEGLCVLGCPWMAVLTPVFMLHKRNLGGGGRGEEKTERERREGKRRQRERER